jgi:hypothetical protein
MKTAQRFSLAFFIALFIFAPIIATEKHRFTAFAFCAVALTGMIAVVGRRVSNNYLGALISEHNVMSLSRFQAVLWTVLIAASFGAVLLSRGVDPKAVVDFFNLHFADRIDLFALMGISYASAVGSDMVTSNKAAKGVVDANSTPAKADFTDMFEGNEIADSDRIDISKVQMFVFTLVGGVVFISMFRQNSAAIPQLPNTLIALMGVSHAAYLGNKTITKTTDAQVAVAANAAAADAAAAQATSLVSNKPASGAVVNP